MERKSRDITIITELYYPEETSTGYILTKIAEGLSKYNHVTVICAQPTYSARGIKAPKHECLHGVDIVRCASSPLDKDRLLYKFLNVVIISLSLFYHMLFRISSNQKVLVVTNPPLLPYLTAIVCWVKRTKYLLLVHDVYPEALVVAGIISADGFFSKLGRWFSNKLYNHSNKIIVLGRDMRELILKKLDKSRAQKVVIIPNWSDVNEIVPNNKDHNPVLNELRLNSKFVIQYAGNMGRTHGLETIIAAAEILSLDKSIHFLFIGSGAKKNWLEHKIKNEIISNITLLPNKPRSESHIFLNACDVAIISFMPGMAGVSVPSRMYNILAAGKPIIAVADPLSELALVIEEEGIGWVVPPDQPGKLADVILNASLHKDELIKMGKRARSAAENKYTLNHVIKSYQSLFSE